MRNGDMKNTCKWHLRMIVFIMILQVNLQEVERQKYKKSIKTGVFQLDDCLQERIGSMHANKLYMRYLMFEKT